MSGLRGEREVDDGPGSIAMQWMRSPNIADCGDDFRGDAKAAAALVPGDVVRDEPEAWGQCPGSAKDTWSWQLPDGAWTWLHKLRRAMVRPGRDLLEGDVEVDETYLGGRETGLIGRKTNKKSIVAIAAEVRDRGTGRIRMACVQDVSAQSLVPFVQRTVCPGARVRTDGWRAYNGLTAVDYQHQATNISAGGDPAHIVMPRVHRVAALVDRWWLGIHHGAISPSQLDYYLDEFTFRFNRRRSKARGLLFYRLLQQAVQLEPVPYRKLVGGKPGGHPQI